ncbi:MAG: hypothetical protein JNJ69_02135 [Leptospiraceae bacterium]|nr:hypothetical protein [Leptospiraceae bacterium]
MRIDTLYIESAAEKFAITAVIRQRLEAKNTEFILDYQDVFSRIKKPYLEKRKERNVILAVKRGAVVREAPAAYGYGNDALHYYYIHAYNCIYECEYCYLQGYFSSPDLVLFVNHEEIMNEMSRVLHEHRGREVWFHAGEFSDSLALSHITGELPAYWNFFSLYPEANLELRTKSVNLSVLRQLTPLPNVVVSFSLSANSQAETYDREAPRTGKRIAAISELARAGFTIGIHFDPIIYSPDFIPQFTSTVKELAQHTAFDSIRYVSLGVVRFAKDVFREARTNYAESQMFARHFIQGRDHKMRYVRPLRMWLLETSREILKKHGCPEEKIYFCME